MRRLTCTLALAASSVFAMCQDPGTIRKTTGNFVTDIKGDPDTRPDTWGTAGVVVKTVTFSPPPGCVVEIVRILGDFVIWPNFAPPPLGSQAGSLLALTPTNVFVCPYSDYTEDSSILYVQAGTSGETVRVPIDQDAVDGFLQADHKLNITLASFLNNTGLTIHMEATLQLRFRFVTPPVSTAARNIPAAKTRWSASK
jgi:hypothetical protein